MKIVFEISTASTRTKRLKGKMLHFSENKRINWVPWLGLWNILMRQVLPV